MEPRIGHWHCRYRLVGAQPEAQLAVERLERDVRPRALAAYNGALVRAFENDPAVYVLRSVNLRLMFKGATAATETWLADEWGQSLGMAVVRSIAMQDEEPANLVRFKDEADYVAHFIADLLNDLAWQRWYYGPFSKLRGLSKAEAILALMLEHREQLAAIFCGLSGLGSLERTLTMLDRTGAAKLWAEAATTITTTVDVNAFRIFVRSAIRLLDRLGLWAASAMTESKLLEEYAAEQPVMPDWTDRRSLAAAVLNVVLYARRRAYLFKLNHEIAQKLSLKSEDIFSGLDWLDTVWLEDTLLSILSGSDETPPVQHAHLPTRAAGSTPLQQQLLKRIRELLKTGIVTLDLEDVGSPLNALRLYAALTAAEPELVFKPATFSLIESVLRCSKWIMAAPEPAAILEAIRGRRKTEALTALPAEAREAMQAIISIGPPAADLLEEIIPAASFNSLRVDETILPTECAGLFLLIRAILDARIPQLAAAADAGPLSSILLALGIQWAGARSLNNGRTDAGLAMWCGLAPQDYSAFDLLSALETTGCRRLLAEVRKLLHERSALDSSLARIEAWPTESTVEDLTAAWPVDTPVNEELVLVATYALRLWALWLPGIAGSSETYLLCNLLRRAGRLHIREHSIEVVLRPAPLDIVLEMASYTKELASVPWLEDRKITFRIERS